MQQAIDDPGERMPAVVTFLVAASGVAILGVSAAFWALVAGLVVRTVLHLGRRYSEHGAKPIDADTAQAYLDEVAAHSAVFPEQTAAGDAEAAHDALSPTGPDRRDRATAALLVAWLQFATATSRTTPSSR